jgi:hypothetical protein
MKRAMAVSLVCCYFAAFSLMLLGVLLWQLATGQIHSRWSDALFPLAFAFMLALIPGVIAMGLWVMDNAARITAIVIALIHAIATVQWAAHPLFGWQWLPPLRIMLDVAIIVVLLRPAIRQAFRVNQIALNLH